MRSTLPGRWRARFLPLIVAANAGCVRVPAGDLVVAPAARGPSPARLLEGPVDSVEVDEGVVYVVTGFSGPSERRLLRSYDQGRSFALWGVDPALCLDSFVVAPSDGTVYAIAARCDHGGAPRRFLVSHDRATTWQRVPVDPPLSLLSVDPHDPRRLFGADLEWWMTSDNGGAHWTELPLPRDLPVLPDAPERLIAPGVEFVDNPVWENGQVLVGEDGALYFFYQDRLHDAAYRSDDHGSTWREIASRPYREYVIASTVFPDGSLLAEGSDRCVILRAPPGRPVAPVFTYPCEARRTWSEVRSEGGRACAIFGGDQVAASDDEGATWRLVPLPHARARRSCVPFGADRLLIAADDGLYEATVPR